MTDLEGLLRAWVDQMSELGQRTSKQFEKDTSQYNEPAFQMKQRGH